MKFPEEPSYKLPIVMPSKDDCDFEKRFIALFIDMRDNKTILPIHKIKDLVRLAKDAFYSDGFMDGSKVNNILNI